MSRTRTIRLAVNGSAIERTVETRVSLADFLRDELRLTGTHLGCEHGACGACTVIMDGVAVRACLTLAVQADGAEVRTVESLGTPQKLDEMQRAFAEHHGLQCGFCTPGFLMTLTAFKTARGDAPPPTEAEVREVLSGNICRCTGYDGIVKAALQVLGGAASTTTHACRKAGSLLRCIGSTQGRRCTAHRPRSLRRRHSTRPAAARVRGAQPACPRTHRSHRLLPRPLRCPACTRCISSTICRKRFSANACRS